ncbi:hypothetical protein NLJ89_g6575 [Agrocybe chaxingu]|uniref:Glycosyltransferase family 28 N-terminal domain-containing protein n=1 Tax=Agrocybe chaxingu TaxID=84603 RepID=A0A9W8K0J8_9AGAR|nr:hypothetical protein NLJ89_g6575 [Agrocybe chaxingu]
MLDVADHISLLPSSPLTPPEDKQPDALYVDVDTSDHDEDQPINYSQYVSQGKGLTSVASISQDGRISVRFDLKDTDSIPDISRNLTDVEEFAVDQEWRDYPSMNIVIMIVGSRGDVQPYVALGQQLAKDGHRVRIATHETFRSFVGDAGLEFFNIGGNPQDLMSYMVKNPGLVPGIESLTNGDIKNKRKMLTEMIKGCWLSCHSPCPEIGRAFAADAIISNPPAFAHIHCAEALGIPLLMSFTMPWSPTTSFAHPLVNITNSNAGSGLSNYLSYVAADLLTWQGIGDIINTFRTKTLGLSPLTLRSGPDFVDRTKVPWTYCMSPALVPKPLDWKNHIDVVGFYFLDLASKYQPSPELAAFLEAGEPPVYIGFGSVVVDDPAAMSHTIFEATQQAGVRALVSAGWGGLGGVFVPPHIFMLGNVPHDWLFDNERVSAVVHHGGAGFLGKHDSQSGCRSETIHHRELTISKLTAAIKFATSPPAKSAAKQLAQKIRDEDGVRKGVESFYKHLPLLNMRCDLDPSRLAVWWSTEHCLKLSAFAAQALSDAKMLDLRSLTLHRPKEYKNRTKSVESLISMGSNLFWYLTNTVCPPPLKPVKSPKSVPGPLPSRPSHGIMSAVALMHEGMMNPTGKQGPATRVSEDSVMENVSKVKEKRASLPTTPTKESERTHTRKEFLVSTLKDAAVKIIHNAKKAPHLDFVSLPVHKGAWKNVQSSAGKDYEHRPRLTRIAAGREDVRKSTASQRAHIIRRFEEECCQTPHRQKLYQDAIRRAVKDGMEIDVSRANGGYRSSRSSGDLPNAPPASRATTMAMPNASGDTGSTTTSVSSFPLVTPLKT